MSLNIANIDRLLAFMRALPPEHFSMESAVRPACGSPGCIVGCANAIGGGTWSTDASAFIGMLYDQAEELFIPDGWMFADATGDFPLARAIDVVQHLRDTGEVDWSRFPPENYRTPAASKPAWSPPVAIEIAPELPESLTRFVREPVAVEG